MSYEFGKSPKDSLKQGLKPNIGSSLGLPKNTQTSDNQINKLSDGFLLQFH